MERDAESAAHSAACTSILTVEKCVYVPTYVLGVGIYHVTTGAPRLRSGDKNRERETRGKWEGEKKNPDGLCRANEEGSGSLNVNLSEDQTTRRRLTDRIDMAV